MIQREQRPGQTLLGLRIIWFALLFGEVMFIIVVTFIVQKTNTQPEMAKNLFYVALAMLAVFVPAGYAIRTAVCRTGLADGVVAMPQYSTGNIILWALCEGPAFCAIVGSMMNTSLFPHLWVAIAAMAIQIINFPTGGPTRGDGSIQPIHKRD